MPSCLGLSQASPPPDGDWGAASAIAGTSPAMTVRERYSFDFVGWNSRYGDKPDKDRVSDSVLRQKTNCLRLFLYRVMKAARTYRTWPSDAF
jgi:hypothetical protein